MVHRGLPLQSSMGKLHRKRLNSRLSGSMRGAGESLKTLRCQTNSDIRVGTDHGDALLSVNMDIHALASAVLLVFVSHGICPVSGSGFSELAPRHFANGGSATLGWDISGTVFHLNPGESGKLLLFCPPPDRHQAFFRHGCRFSNNQLEHRYYRGDIRSAAEHEGRKLPVSPFREGNSGA